MKATELSINDWVLAEGEPVKVTTIGVLGGDFVGTLAPFSSRENTYADNAVALERGAKKLSLLEPIKLTEEILKANDPQWFGDDLTCVSLLVNGMAFGKTIVYVHELQQALRAAGLYDLANDFKLEFGY